MRLRRNEYCPVHNSLTCCGRELFPEKACEKEFSDYYDVVPDYKNPKGMGGAGRVDHPDNIQATHWWCNEEKGSREWIDLRPIGRLR